jgi:hypothetical protein
MNLFSQACSYRNAAEHLIEDGSDFDHPSYFCLAHGIELLLKSYLAGRGIKRNELDTHCLECLWASCQRLGLRVDSVGNMGDRMYAMNPYSSLFRYPDMDIKIRLDRREMIETFDQSFRFIQPTVIHARLSVPRGQYEVDIFTHGVGLTEL